MIMIPGKAPVMSWLLFFPMLVACSGPDKSVEMTRPDIAAVLGGNATAGFLQAEGTRTFSFPADHGPHPGYRNEWWYITGNLLARDGRRFGYQLTYFYMALHPGETARQGNPWEADRVWMAHLALTDAENGRHWSAERFSRDNPGLAGATSESVWLDDWQLNIGGEGQPWQLNARDADSASGLVDFTLLPLKPPVLQGVDGLSRKNAGAGNASWYYSISRMQTSGILLVDGEPLQVNGQSWLDREWSTSVLADSQSGWNWFSLQLDDGEEIMYYQLLDTRGNPGGFSSGTRTDAGGEQHRISAADIQLTPVSSWTGPDGLHYPTVWQMQTGERNLRLEAVVENQFMDTLIPYWEGAVDIRDETTGELLGYGYLEMVR
jgi:predicted secreted hydrolase